MILIYSDSQIIDLEWLPRLGLPQDTIVTKSLEEYVNLAQGPKIAFTAHRLHADHDTDIQFEIKIRTLSQASLCVFALESELHQFHWSIWAACHADNVYWIMPGTVNDKDSMREHIVPWQDWLKTTSLLYQQLPATLSRLRPWDAKPKMFDCLLGSPKPHRNFVCDAVKQHGLEDVVTMTYGGSWDNKTFYARDYFIFEPGTEIIDPLIGTCDWVRYQGIQCHLSQIMPIDVYNTTAYSIVAETDADNSLSFFSEKTAKPMIARRLFVAFTGYKFLRNLRELGFQTFGSVINESYDDIFHSAQRYQAAFEQVRQLCAMDQAEVLDKIRPVLEHNYQHVMITDWTQFSCDRVKSIMASAIVA